MKRRRRALACIVVGYAALGTAQAQTALDIGKLCGGGGPVTSGQLLGRLMTQLKAPSFGAWDADGDGSDTLQEKGRAILDRNYCSGAGKGHCAAGDQAVFDILREGLGLFLGDSQVSVTQTELPSLQDSRKWPFLNSHPLAYLFDDRQRFGTIRCNVAASGAAEPQPAPAKDKKGGWSFGDALRVTKTIDGLSLARGNKDKLAAVPQADVSYVDDRAAKTRTFNITATVGLDLLPESGETLIPYATFSRKRVQTANTNSGNVSQWGFGVVYSQELGSGDLFSGTASFLFDDEDHSRVGSLRATWRPGFLRGSPDLPFGRALPYGPFDLKLDARLLVHGGHAFEAGTNAALIANRGFLRAGPEVKAQLWFLATEPFFSRFSADASYKRMFKLAGPQAVSWLDLGMNYTFDEDGHWSLRYSYERGEDDDSLKKTDQWKLSLGVRY